MSILLSKKRSSNKYTFTGLVSPTPIKTFKRHPARPARSATLLQCDALRIYRQSLRLPLPPASPCLPCPTLSFKPVGPPPPFASHSAFASTDYEKLPRQFCK